MSYRVDGQYPDRQSSRFARQRLEPFLRRLASACGSPNEPDRPDAWFYALPDFSPSLNEYRIAEGVPVGGLLGWSKAYTNLVPAAVPINGCGIILARLSKSMQPAEALNRLRTGTISKQKIGRKDIILDIGHKNHFLNWYRDNDNVCYLMLHCSLPEYKDDVVANLNRTEINTPSGSISCYVDVEADRFRDYASMVERLAVAKRELILDHLAPDATVLFNQNHVRLLHPTTAAIGCYASEAPMRNVPLTTRPGGPAYLVNTKVSILTPAGPLFLQPHGTGNNMRQPGRVTFDKDSKIFRVEGATQDIYDNATDVFDGYTDMTSVASFFAPWIGSHSLSIILESSGQLKLRHAESYC